MDAPYTGKPEARTGLQELYKARQREALAWVVSPLKDLKGKEFKSFHVRHEASMLELFFDLFFVANLATFTAYHGITTSGNVAAYIGFFLILWSTWFQITIFDVRFAADSVFERVCKVAQFITFAIFAAVGAVFNPGTEESAKYYRIYQTMAIILGFSRLVLAIQYTVVAIFICGKYKNLVAPFILIVLTFLISGGCLAATFVGFKYSEVSVIHVVWWIILPVESLIIVTISSVWRMLSFKQTHMNERLSLLTMIIIGEGVIGVSKTVGYLWPTEAPPKWGIVLALLSIVVMLLLIWQIYFDNHPHGDYGTIKQQWWALSHFFLHLGIVGMVEGANRMATIHYATQIYVGILNTISYLCTPPLVSREDFVNYMNETLQKIKIDNYDPRSYDVAQYLLNITLYPDETPDFCNLTPGGGVDGYDPSTLLIEEYAVRGTFKRFDIEAAPRGDGYLHTFKVTFIYLWCSVALSMLMLLLYLWIVRRKKHDVLEIIRMSFRFIIALVAIAIACLQFSQTAFWNYISSPWVVFTICFLISLTLIVDRICRLLGVRNFKKRYAIPPPDVGHGHGSGVEHHSSMAFGGHHNTIAPTMLSGQGYEMVPNPAALGQNGVPLPQPRYQQYSGQQQQPPQQGMYYNGGFQGQENTAYKGIADINSYPVSPR